MSTPNFSIYELVSSSGNGNLVMRFPGQSSLKTLNELGIISITTLTDIVLFDSTSTGTLLTNVTKDIEFTITKPSADRISSVKVNLVAIGMFIPTVYVSNFPRDVKVFLNLVQNLLKSNDIENTHSVSIKRDLIDKIEKLKFSIQSIDEFQDFKLDLEGNLRSVNESEDFISAVKNCTIGVAPYQDLLEQVRRTDDERNQFTFHTQSALNLSSFSATGPAEIGLDGSHADSTTNNSTPASSSFVDQTQSLVNVPTSRYDTSGNNILSPLYGVKPFTMMMYQPEELNTNKFSGSNPTAVADSQNMNSYPINTTLPSVSQSGTGFPEHLSFMASVNKSDGTTNIGHIPTKVSNSAQVNPWKEDIKSVFVAGGAQGFDNFTGVAEGRAPSVAGEHISWESNPVENIVSTCIAGIQTNTGFRDNGQRHGYAMGEFAPGGLYHRTMEVEDDSGNVINFIDGTTAGIPGKFHGGFPVQEQDALWTFDGTFPPKQLMARYGEPVVFRNYNMLPIDPTANRGFGLHTISTHEHNGHTDSTSDGYAQNYFFPGEYYDYLFPMIPSGHKTLNLDKIDPMSAGPGDWVRDSSGQPIIVNGKKSPRDHIFTSGPPTEIMSTHWFHDHMLDFTAQNVYKGSTGFMNYYSTIDRGNEEINDGINLRLPSGTDLSWGNRDYDVYMALMDKSWDDESVTNTDGSNGGQLWFNPFNTNGFMGDRNLVNWVYRPYFKVRARKYRFRILNASVSRWYKYALVVKRNSNIGNFSGPSGSGISYDAVPFHMIANDGNLMVHAINFDGSLGTTRGIVPTQAVAERYDLIINFSQFNAGDKLYFVNLLEHRNGKRPQQMVSLESVLNGTYQGLIDQKLGDPCVESFLEFRVHAMEPGAVDLSMDPSDYEFRKKKLIDIVPIKEEEIKYAIQRRFDFVNHISEDGIALDDQWAIETDNEGVTRQMDPTLISAAPRLNTGELWHLVNGGASWAHNIHIHFTEGKILLRDNKIPPIWEQLARKDVYRIGGADGGDGSTDMWIYLNFKDQPGTYMMHCHNTQHEDHAMLLRWDIQEESVKTAGISTSLPTWHGVEFLETHALPTFRSGITQDNSEYMNPNSILNTLRRLNRTVPNEQGAIWVDGLSNNIDSTRFLPTEGRTGFKREPLGSRIKGTGGLTGAGNAPSVSIGGTSVVAGSSSGLCTCGSRGALALTINGTNQSNAWFNASVGEPQPNNMNDCNIVKFKKGDVITIQTTSGALEHGGYLKLEGMGNLNVPSVNLLDLSNLVTYINSSEMLSNSIFTNTIELDTIVGQNFTGATDTIGEITSLGPVHLTEFTNSFTGTIFDFIFPGTPFHFKTVTPGNVIAKFTIKNSAASGQRGVWICSNHGVSMSYNFEIC